MEIFEIHCSNMILSGGMSSDIDMRVKASEKMIPVSRDHVDRQKLNHIIKDKRINLTDLEGIELSASKIAKGGNE